MADTFRIASFNVENLFERPRVFNFEDKSVGDAVISRIDAFQKILRKDRYSAADKRFLLREFTKDGSTPQDEALKNYILLREDRGKLWEKRGFATVGVVAKGRSDVDLTIEFKKAKWNVRARENTARVIKTVKADVACIVEADDRISLRRFDAQMLGSRYRYEMLIDGNDMRGIDVGLYSKYPVGGIWTHMFDGTSRSKTFSRDCPEFEVILPSGESLYVLCNHLKSKGYGDKERNDARRKSQAEAIADILRSYDLRNDLVVVAGDLNDTPDSNPLKPLLRSRNLSDALKLQFGSDMSKRWTYHFRSFEQIDYLVVSKALKERFVEAGVERRGIYKLNELTSGNDSIQNEFEFEGVTSWKNQASDHGAVWADFLL